MDDNFIDMLLRFLIQSRERTPMPQDYAGPAAMGGPSGLMESAALMKGGVRPPQPPPTMPQPQQAGMGQIRPGDPVRRDLYTLDTLFH